MTPPPTSSATSLPRSVRLTFAVNIFLACCSFAIVMPSLWPYLDQLGGTTACLAWVVAGYSGGEAGGALAFGWLYGRAQPRPLLIGAVALSAAGSLLYGLAGVLDPPLAIGAVLVARVVQGIGSGAEQAVEQAVVGEYVAPAQRTQATGELSSWAMLGFLAGPVCGIPLTLVGGARFGPFVVDANAGPGAFIGVCNLVMLALTWSTFRPGPRMIRTGGATTGGDGGPRQSRTDSVESAAAAATWSRSRPSSGLSSADWTAVRLCMLIFLVHFCGFAAIETICTPLIADQFHWGVTASFALFTVSAVVSLTAMVVLGQAQNWVRDCDLLFVTLLLGLFGFAISAFDLQRYAGAQRYVLGFVSVSVAFPLGRALTLSLLSKIADRSADQGLYLGTAFAIGAIARMVGPFVAVTVQPVTLFRICAALFAVTAALQLQFWSDLVKSETADDGAVIIAKTAVPSSSSSSSMARRLSLYDKRLPPSPTPLSQPYSDQYMALL